jgi:hypothetical protein
MDWFVKEIRTFMFFSSRNQGSSRYLFWVVASVVWWKVTDVSEELVVSIIRAMRDVDRKHI